MALHDIELSFTVSESLRFRLPCQEWQGRLPLQPVGARVVRADVVIRNSRFSTSVFPRPEDDVRHIDLLTRVRIDIVWRAESCYARMADLATCTDGRKSCRATPNYNSISTTPDGFHHCCASRC